MHLVKMMCTNGAHVDGVAGALQVDICHKMIIFVRANFIIQTKLIYFV